MSNTVKIDSSSPKDRTVQVGGAAFTASLVLKAYIAFVILQVQAHIKLHNAWNKRGMTTKQGTLYKWEEPNAITPTARGSGNCEAVFSSLLWRDGEICISQTTLWAKRKHVKSFTYLWKLNIVISCLYLLFKFCVFIYILCIYLNFVYLFAFPIILFLVFCLVLLEAGSHHVDLAGLELAL